MNIPALRLLNQQLLNPQFRTPKELVSWMGAVQAQDYTMAKWAVGMRLKKAALQSIEKALHEGEIFRIHVMRPTWHLIAAEDVRWMLKLSAPRIRQANDSYAKGYGLEIAESLYAKSNDLLEKILCGGRSMTKPEITEFFNEAGMPADKFHMIRFLERAETEGVVCSGHIRGRQHTYALLEERVPFMPDLTKEESLARLAKSYFRSHAPAVLQDFIWWSGLSVTDAKDAIALIDTELVKEQWRERLWYVHDSCRRSGTVSGNLHLLPPYDELLLGYKDRSDVLPKEYYRRAFTNNGLFYPVVLHEGQIIGNWNKVEKKKMLEFSYSFFQDKISPDENLLSRAQQKYIQFIRG